jgi:hypothetical protein
MREATPRSHGESCPTSASSAAAIMRRAPSRARSSSVTATSLPSPAGSLRTSSMACLAAGAFHRRRSSATGKVRRLAIERAQTERRAGRGRSPPSPHGTSQAGLGRTAWRTHTRRGVRRHMALGRTELLIVRERAFALPCATSRMPSASIGTLGRRGSSRRPEVVGKCPYATVVWRAPLGRGHRPCNGNMASSASPEFSSYPGVLRWVREGGAAFLTAVRSPAAKPNASPALAGVTVPRLRGRRLDVARTSCLARACVTASVAAASSRPSSSPTGERCHRAAALALVSSAERGSRSTSTATAERLTVSRDASHRVGRLSCGSVAA